MSLKKSVDEAVDGEIRRACARGAAHRHRHPVDRGRDLWWHDIVEKASPEHTPEAFDSEHPLFLLYTSGTTGKPKGIVHTSVDT